MSGGGFRGRGYGPRGFRPSGPAGGVGGPRYPHPNFNHPRRGNRHPTPDVWLEHPVLPPWQQLAGPLQFQNFQQRPSFRGDHAFRLNHGGGPCVRGGRGRGQKNRGGINGPCMVGPPGPRFPGPICGRGINMGNRGRGSWNQYIKLNVPRNKPEPPPLGSEEERQLKITETADKLKQKLSSNTIDEPVNFWDDDLGNMPSPALEESVTSNRGIPELRHDPPELNLTFNDFKDIGRVDLDGGTIFDDSTVGPDPLQCETEAAVASICPLEQERDNTEAKDNFVFENHSEETMILDSLDTVQQKNEGAQIPRNMECAQETTPEPQTVSNEEQSIVPDEPLTEPMENVIRVEPCFSTDICITLTNFQEDEFPFLKNLSGAEDNVQINDEPLVVQEENLQNESTPEEMSEKTQEFISEMRLGFQPEIRKRFQPQIRPEFQPRFECRPDFIPTHSNQGPKFNPRLRGALRPRMLDQRQSTSKTQQQEIVPLRTFDPRGGSSVYNPRAPPPKLGAPHNQEQLRPGSLFHPTELSPRLGPVPKHEELQPSPAFDPRGPPRFSSQEEIMQPPPAFDPRPRTTVADSSSLLPPPAFDPRGPSNMMTVGLMDPPPISDFSAISSNFPQLPHMHMGHPRHPGFVSSHHTNFAPNLHLPSKPQSLVHKFPPPRITMEPVLAPVALLPPPMPTGALEIRPPLPKDPPSINESQFPLLEQTSTPNMDDELVEMQEALEFAKQLMSMSNDEDSLQFHMPTFPDLPPVIAASPQGHSSPPPLPPEPVQSPNLDKRKPKEHRSKRSKHVDHQHVEFGPQPLPNELHDVKCRTHAIDCYDPTQDNSISNLEEDSLLPEDQSRRKVVFNLNSKMKKISKMDEWQNQNEDVSPKIKKLKIHQTFSPTIKEKTIEQQTEIELDPTHAVPHHVDAEKQDAPHTEKAHINGHDGRKREKRDSKRKRWDKKDRSRERGRSKDRRRKEKSQSRSPAKANVPSKDRHHKDKSKERSPSRSPSPANCNDQQKIKDVQKDNCQPDDSNDVLSKTLPINYEDSRNMLMAVPVKPRSLSTSTPGCSWKDKVINRFLKMSKNDICNMVNNSGLRKFDIAMKHLVKEKRTSLSQEMRISADDKVKGYDMSREEFMSQLSAMLDPSATVDLTNLPTEFIHHLGEVLQMDLEPNHAETTDILCVDPEVNLSDVVDTSNMLDLGNIDINDDNLLNNYNTQDFNKFMDPNVTVNDYAGENSMQNMKMELDSSRDIHLSHDINVSDYHLDNTTDFSNLFPDIQGVKETTECENNIFNETQTAGSGIDYEKQSTLPNMADLDDIFSAGIAKAKLALKPDQKKITKQSSLELDELFSVGITKIKLSKPVEPEQTLERTTVDLDDIFSAGIVKAKLASLKPEENEVITKKAPNRKSSPEEPFTQFDNTERWNRKKREDPDMFRNLTKEEWEAKYGRPMDSVTEKEFRAHRKESSSMDTTQSASSHSPKISDGIKPLRTKRNYRTNRNHSPPSPMRNRSPSPALADHDNIEFERLHEQYTVIEDDEAVKSMSDNDTSSSSGSSSANSNTATPDVTKLLKVIKEREKIAKKKSLNETIRDEVAAEIERAKRKEKEKLKERKARKKEKEKKKKEKREKRKKRKKRRKSEQDEIEMQQGSQKLLADDEIKKEVEIKKEPGLEEEQSAQSNTQAVTPSQSGKTKKTNFLPIIRSHENDLTSPQQSSTQTVQKTATAMSAIQSDKSKNSISTSIAQSPHNEETANSRQLKTQEKSVHRSSIQQLKTKAQLKEMPEIIASKVQETFSDNKSVSVIDKASLKSKECTASENTVAPIEKQSIEQNQAVVKQAVEAEKITADVDEPTETVEKAVKKVTSLMISEQISNAISETNVSTNYGRKCSAIDNATSDVTTTTSTATTDNTESEKVNATSTTTTEVSVKSEPQLSKSGAKKIDIQAYKARTLRRKIEKQQKLNELEANPDMLTEDLLNLPVPNKKTERPEEEQDKKIAIGKEEKTQSEKSFNDSSRQKDPRLQRKKDPEQITSNSEKAENTNKSESTQSIDKTQDAKGSTIRHTLHCSHDSPKLRHEKSQKDIVDKSTIQQTGQSSQTNKSGNKLDKPKQKPEKVANQPIKCEPFGHKKTIEQEAKPKINAPEKPIVDGKRDKRHKRRTSKDSEKSTSSNDSQKKIKEQSLKAVENSVNIDIQENTKSVPLRRAGPPVEQVKIQMNTGSQAESIVEVKHKKTKKKSDLFDETPSKITNPLAKSDNTPAESKQLNLEKLKNVPEIKESIIPTKKKIGPLSHKIALAKKETEHLRQGEEVTVNMKNTTRECEKLQKSGSGTGSDTNKKMEGLAQKGPIKLRRQSIIFENTTQRISEVDIEKIPLVPDLKENVSVASSLESTLDEGINKFKNIRSEGSKELKLMKEKIRRRSQESLKKDSKSIATVPSTGKLHSEVTQTANRVGSRMNQPKNIPELEQPDDTDKHLHAEAKKTEEVGSQNSMKKYVEPITTESNIQTGKSSIGDTKITESAHSTLNKPENIAELKQLEEANMLPEFQDLLKIDAQLITVEENIQSKILSSDDTESELLVDSTMKKSENITDTRQSEEACELPQLNKMKTKQEKSVTLLSLVDISKQLIVSAVDQSVNPEDITDDGKIDTAIIEEENQKRSKLQTGFISSSGMKEDLAIETGISKKQDEIPTSKFKVTEDSLPGIARVDPLIEFLNKPGKNLGDETNIRKLETKDIQESINLDSESMVNDSENVDSLISNKLPDSRANEEISKCDEKNQANLTATERETVLQEVLASNFEKTTPNEFDEQLTSEHPQKRESLANDWEGSMPSCEKLKTEEVSADTQLKSDKQSDGNIESIEEGPSIANKMNLIEADNLLHSVEIVPNIQEKAENSQTEEYMPNLMVSHESNIQERIIENHSLVAENLINPQARMHFDELKVSTPKRTPTKAQRKEMPETRTPRLNSPESLNKQCEGYLKETTKTSVTGKRKLLDVVMDETCDTVSTKKCKDFDIITAIMIDNENDDHKNTFERVNPDEKSILETVGYTTDPVLLEGDETADLTKDCSKDTHSELAITDAISMRGELDNVEPNKAIDIPHNETANRTEENNSIGDENQFQINEQSVINGKQSQNADEVVNYDTEIINDPMKPSLTTVKTKFQLTLEDSHPKSPNEIQEIKGILNSQPNEDIGQEEIEVETREDILALETTKTDDSGSASEEFERIVEDDQIIQSSESESGKVEDKIQGNVLTCEEKVSAEAEGIIDNSKNFEDINPFTKEEESFRRTVTPTGDTISLNSSIDFENGEFIVLSEVSSEEDFSDYDKDKPEKRIRFELIRKIGTPATSESDVFVEANKVHSIPDTPCTSPFTTLLRDAEEVTTKDKNIMIDTKPEKVSPETSAKPATNDTPNVDCTVVSEKNMPRPQLPSKPPKKISEVVLEKSITVLLKPPEEDQNYLRNISQKEQNMTDLKIINVTSLTAAKSTNTDTSTHKISLGEKDPEQMEPTNTIPAKNTDKQTSDTEPIEETLSIEESDRNLEVTETTLVKHVRGLDTNETSITDLQLRTESAICNKEVVSHDKEKSLKQEEIFLHFANSTPNSKSPKPPKHQDKIVNRDMTEVNFHDRFYNERVDGSSEVDALREDDVEANLHQIEVGKYQVKEKLNTSSDTTYNLNKSREADAEVESIINVLEGKEASYCSLSYNNISQEYTSVNNENTVPASETPIGEEIERIKMTSNCSVVQQDICKPYITQNDDTNTLAHHVTGKKTPFVELEKLKDLVVLAKGTEPVISSKSVTMAEPDTLTKDKTHHSSTEHNKDKHLHKIKHKHKMKHKKDKKHKLSDKNLRDTMKDENMVTLVKKPQTKEAVMARMIEIDVEIHKLMSEKMNLYQMLQSGTLPTDGSMANNKTEPPAKMAEGPTRPRTPSTLMSELIHNLGTGPSTSAQPVAKSSTEYTDSKISEHNKMEPPHATKHKLGIKSATETLQLKPKKSVPSHTSDDEEVSRYTEVRKTPTSMKKRKRNKDEKSIRWESIVDSESGSSTRETSLDRPVDAMKSILKKKAIDDESSRDRPRSRVSRKIDLNEVTSGRPRSRAGKKFEAEDSKERPRSRTGKKIEFEITCGQETKGRPRSRVGKKFDSGIGVSQELPERPQSRVGKKLEAASNDPPTRPRSRAGRKVETFTSEVPVHRPRSRVGKNIDVEGIDSKEQKQRPLSRAGKKSKLPPESVKGNVVAKPLQNELPMRKAEKLSDWKTQGRQQIYSDESTQETVIPDTVEVKKPTTGLLLLEETFKREMAISKKQKSEARKEKREKLKHLLQSVHTLTPAEEDMPLSVLYIKKLVQKRDLLKNLNSMFNKLGTPNDKKKPVSSSNVLENAIAVIDAVAENRMEQLHLPETSITDIAIPLKSSIEIAEPQKTSEEITQPIRTPIEIHKPTEIVVEDIGSHKETIHLRETETLGYDSEHSDQLDADFSDLPEVEDITDTLPSTSDKIEDIIGIKSSQNIVHGEVHDNLHSVSVYPVLPENIMESDDEVGGHRDEMLSKHAAISSNNEVEDVIGNIQDDDEFDKQDDRLDDMEELHNVEDIIGASPHIEIDRSDDMMEPPMVDNVPKRTPSKKIPIDEVMEISREFDEVDIEEDKVTIETNEAITPRSIESKEVPEFKNLDTEKIQEIIHMEKRTHETSHLDLDSMIEENLSQDSLVLRDQSDDDDTASQDKPVEEYISNYIEDISNRHQNAHTSTPVHLMGQSNSSVSSFKDVERDLDVLDSIIEKVNSDIEETSKDVPTPNPVVTDETSQTVASAEDMQADNEVMEAFSNGPRDALKETIIPVSSDSMVVPESLRSVDQVSQEEVSLQQLCNKLNEAHKQIEKKIHQVETSNQEKSSMTSESPATKLESSSFSQDGEFVDTKSQKRSKKEQGPITLRRSSRHADEIAQKTSKRGRNSKITNHEIIDTLAPPDRKRQISWSGSSPTQISATATNDPTENQKKRRITQKPQTRPSVVTRRRLNITESDAPLVDHQDQISTPQTSLHSTRTDTNQTVTSGKDIHRRGRKRKSMNRSQMMNCKVRLVDCRHTYLRADSQPGVLQKFGTSMINPHECTTSVRENIVSDTAGNDQIAPPLLQELTVQPVEVAERITEQTTSMERVSIEQAVVTPEDVGSQNTAETMLNIIMSPGSIQRVIHMDKSPENEVKPHASKVQKQGTQPRTAQRAKRLDKVGAELQEVRNLRSLERFKPDGLESRRSSTTPQQRIQLRGFDPQPTATPNSEGQSRTQKTQIGVPETQALLDRPVTDVNQRLRPKPLSKLMDPKHHPKMSTPQPQDSNTPRSLPEIEIVEERNAVLTTRVPMDDVQTADPQSSSKTAETEDLETVRTLYTSHKGPILDIKVKRPKRRKRKQRK